MESRVKIRTFLPPPHSRINIVIDNNVLTIYNNSVQCHTYITLRYLHEFTTVIFYFRKITVVYRYDFYIHLQSFDAVSLLQYDLGNARTYTLEEFLHIVRYYFTYKHADIEKYDALFAKYSSIVKCKPNGLDGFSVYSGKNFQYIYNDISITA